MDLNNAIVDQIHIFKDENFVTKSVIMSGKISIVEQKNTNQLFYLIKKAEKYIDNTKYAFIRYLEKSIQLIHPSIINLSGFSIEKPYLYFKYSQDSQNISNIKLTDENMQKIFIGLASGLSYLLLKGYNLTNFSFDSIIFDQNLFPKIIDYINFDDPSKNSEDELIIKYVNFIKIIISKENKKESSKIPINEELKSLFERCEKKTDLPTFSEFIEFFKSTPFRGDSDFLKCAPFLRYLQILRLSDKSIFDNFISLDFNDNYQDFDSIEQICFHFVRTRKMTELSDDDIFLLNSLPEHYIKPLVKFIQPLSDKLIRFLYVDDITLILPNWKNILKSNENPFEIYKVIMNKINELENKKKDISLFSNKQKHFNYQIESLRIKAIHFLKEASKILQDPKIKIELSVQYIKGSILPYNYNKALNILNSITVADEKTRLLINQMKYKISNKINSSSIDNIISNASQNQKEILEKVKQGDILSLLYAGFAFYIGFNGFPIIPSLSIQCYRAAAKKSADAMGLIGYLYFNGMIFPQNLKRAQKYFKIASDMGSMKAKIIDGLLRKHIWRNYLVQFDVNILYNNYLQSFKSIIPNDSLAFSKINYSLENKQKVNYFKKLEFGPSDDYFLTNYLVYNNIREWRKSIKPCYSEKILLSSEINENTNDVNEQIFIAKSYLNGDNNFPVNYKKAAEFFKLAADNGNSDAQWQYAILCLNYIGGNIKDAENYLEKSIEQNNIKGRFYYALYLKQKKKNMDLFEIFIKDCAESEDLDSMYYYALHLENDKGKIDESIELYKKAANQGHFDSLIRLINISENHSKKDLYQKYLELSVGLFDEQLLFKLIKFYDQNECYDESNLIIQAGIELNSQLYNFYYAYHLIYGKGMDVNNQRAEKLALLAFENKYPIEYLEKYIYIFPLMYVNNNEQEKACFYLMVHKKYINERNQYFFNLFYQKLDKKLARKCFIPGCFYYKGFIECHYYLSEVFFKNPNLLYLYTNLTNEAKYNKNPFAMAILGKLYKQGKILIRNLETSIKFFARSAEKKCPLGYYYIGKEYFYGRYIDQNYKKALKFLMLAIKNNQEPRAAYYIYKILNIEKDENINAREILKIGVTFGHKRALYKYGHLLYKEKNKSEGSEYIKQASILGYKKAKFFCIKHGIPFKNNKKKNDSKKDEDIKIVNLDYTPNSSLNEDDESTYYLVNLQEGAINIGSDEGELSLNLSSNNNDDDSSFSDLFDYWQ